MAFVKQDVYFAHKMQSQANRRAMFVYSEFEMDSDRNEYFSSLNEYSAMFRPEVADGQAHIRPRGGTRIGLTDGLVGLSRQTTSLLLGQFPVSGQTEGVRATS